MPRAKSYHQPPQLTVCDDPTPAQVLAFELLAANGEYITDWALGWHLKRKNPERPYETDEELREWGYRILTDMVERDWLLYAPPRNSGFDEGFAYCLPEIEDDEVEQPPTLTERFGRAA